MDDVLRLVFEDAADLARTAKAELAKGAVVASKRGGGRTSLGWLCGIALPRTWFVWLGY